MSQVRLLFPHVCEFVENCKNYDFIRVTPNFRSKYPQLIQMMCEEIAEQLIYKYVVYDTYEFLSFSYLDDFVHWHRVEDYDADIRCFVNDEFICAIHKDVLQLENTYNTYKLTIFDVLINYTCADVTNQIIYFLQDDLCKAVEFIVAHKEQYIRIFSHYNYQTHKEQYTILFSNMHEFIELRNSYFGSTKRTF